MFEGLKCYAVNFFFNRNFNIFFTLTKMKKKYFS